MLGKSLIILLTIIFFSSCSNSDTVKEYYKSGELKKQYNILDGQKTGKEVEYFKDGSIKSEGEWNENERNGSLVEYFANGDTFRITNWRDNMQVGLQRKLNKDGTVYTKGYYKDNKRKRVLVFRNDILSEKQLYNDKERLVYVSLYDSLGKKVNEFLPLLFEDSKDTIRIGVQHKLKMNIGMELSGKLNIYTGNLDQNELLKDSIKINKSNGYYEYTITPKESGTMIIPFVYQYQPSKNDTINISGMLTKHTVYVVDSLLRV